MTWDQLSINKPHLVYIILGGFTSIFMLVSLFVKEKLYIGEATVATICGLIFGPHAANLINPLSWGNTDQITLEFSRIVLVVQCFAVGVELPKSYMERHWKSVALLLVPVMTFGWLITSLFIWWMIVPLSWLESLCVAACVTATDPVLASSVVGKGKFAKRVPRHIRDLLSAESGCNDGMAFPFIYLALYLIRYHLNAGEVTFHWICYTILYECIWGATFGVLVGYIARHAIRLAERKVLIDRESFLVFYFVLALFCAGAGSMLGMDDLLIGFAAGVGFSNDGWFTERTHETHVSDVIDLLLNLSYFVYLGTIIPWDQYNNDLYGVQVWRLVVIALLVIFFRRIPAMMALKPIIPDIKTWREALFCGHFGPIGVGAIFVAILARAELETGETTPLANPDPENAEYPLIYLIWPVVTFLVVTSIVVHGSSIAVFTLGKRINTLTLTMSFTKDNDNTQNWMNRLPRIASQSKSLGRSFSSDRSDWSLDEKDMEKAPSGLAIPKFALKRIKEGERPSSRASSRTRSRSRRRKNRKHFEDGEGPGGRIDPSAIHPARRSEPNLTTTESGSDTLVQQSERPSPGDPDQEKGSDERGRRAQSGDSDSDRGDETPRHRQRASGGKHDSRRSSGDEEEDVDVEAYEEGHELIVEDTEGNVLTQVETAGRSDREKAKIIDSAKNKLRKDTTGEYARRESEPHERDEGEELQRQVSAIAGHPDKTFKDHFKGWRGFGRKGEDGDKQGESSKKTKKQPERKSGPAHAYMYGNTVVIEDEDGEVIKEYTIPKEQGDNANGYGDRVRTGVQRMGTFIGISDRKKSAAIPPVAPTDNGQDQMGNVEKERNGSDRGAEAEVPVEANQSAEPQARNKRTAHLRRGISTDSNISEDDGLRMTVSRAETYGLTGLQKSRADRPDTLQDTSRRMSTRDLFKHLQQLDKQRLDKQAKKEVLKSDQVDERTKRAIRESEAEKPRTRVKRAGTMPTAVTPSKTPPTTNHSEEEAADYFSTQPTSPRGHQRGRSKSDVNTAAPTTTRRNDDAFDEDVPETPDIPTHNVRGSVFRHGRGQTAADRRRARYESNAGTAAAAAAPEAQTIHEDDEDGVDEQETSAARRRRLAALGQNRNDSDDAAEALEQYHNETGAERRRRLAALRQREQESSYRPSRRRADDSDDEKETAAEERRRLAALGKAENESSSSSDEDEQEPRRPRHAVPEPGQEPAPRQAQAPQQRTRIQWGGVARDGQEEDLEAQRPNNGAADGHGEGRGIVGRLRRGLTKRE